MDSIDEHADQGTTQGSADARDFIADLESPVLTTWLNDEDLPPPEPLEFTTWDSDLPLPELNELAASPQACLPPPPEEAPASLDDKPAEPPALFPWNCDAQEPANKTEHGARDADRVGPMPLDDVDSTPEPPRDLLSSGDGLHRPEPSSPCEFLAPEAPSTKATCDKDARERLRRDQMKEYATRLWPGASQTPAGAAMCHPHLICTLADEDFALPLTSVVEVQRLPAVTPVPHTPEWLMGVANRRGDILSVVDLAAFLGRETAAPSPSRRLVVVKASRDGLTIGLVVDQVRGILGLAPEVIAPSTRMCKAGTAPYARGIFESAGRSSTILDLDGLLLSTRMRRLDLD